MHVYEIYMHVTICPAIVCLIGPKMEIKIIVPVLFGQYTYYSRHSELAIATAAAQCKLKLGGECMHALV